MPGIVQRLERLEAGEHAEDAIEPAARRLAVHVRAGDHRRRGRLPPGPADEQVGDVVDRGPVAARARPLQQQRPGPDVLAGQRLAADAAARDLADLGHGHVPAPEPRLIDRRAPRFAASWVIPSPGDGRGSRRPAACNAAPDVAMIRVRQPGLPSPMTPRAFDPDASRPRPCSTSTTSRFCPGSACPRLRSRVSPRTVCSARGPTSAFP